MSNGKGKKLSNTVSRTIFQKAAMKTNARNIIPHPQRGGYRL